MNNASGGLGRRQKNHSAALRDPGTRAALDELAKQWNDLDPVERGERLASLLQRGCSSRGLARELPCSESAVRWCAAIGRLSDEDKQAIRQGRSAGAVLKAAQQHRRDESLKQRCQSEEQARAVSSQLASAGREWLDDQSLCRGYTEQFLLEAERRLWKARPVNSGRPIPQDPDGIRPTIASCRPDRERPRYGPDQLEFLLGWFLDWLPRAAPEPRVQDRVLAELKRPYHL